LTAAHDVVQGTRLPTDKDVLERWVPLGGSVAVGLFKNSFGDANFFVSKSEFTKIGGFSEERGVGLEDHEFHAKWVLSGNQMEVIPASLLYYRMHDKATQMVYSTDPLMNQLRYLRSYSGAFEDSTEMFRFINAKRSVSISCNETVVNGTEITELGGTIYFTGEGYDCAEPFVVNFDETSHSCSVNEGSITATSFSCTANWFSDPFPHTGPTTVTVHFQNGDSIQVDITVVPVIPPYLDE
jgi:hypothetical protein